MLFSICRVVWTRATSFGCLLVLGEGVWGVFSEKMTEFSTFSCFWVKSAIMDVVLRAVAVVEGTIEFKEVLYSVGEEKTENFVKISLAETA